jgi:hypothetical protein
MAGHPVSSSFAPRRSQMIRASAQPAVELRRAFAELDSPAGIADLSDRLIARLEKLAGATPAVALVQRFAQDRLDQLAGKKRA